MRCPGCLTELPPEANFCLNCGHKLSDKAAPSRTLLTLEAERKRVTALYSDLSGYTAITEMLDPEEVKEITSLVFSGIREVVGKYEGFIEHFVGDGVLVLFGVPKAHEDDPIRAVHAAREIHELVESLSPQYLSKIGRALSMHSGINTGLAVTADVDPKQGTRGVTGDAVNIAARLSDLAPAGEILVGHDTLRACQNHFAFEPIGPARVTGKSEPIPVFKLIVDRSSSLSGRKGRQIFSAMVGRDRELSLLESKVRDAINGKGSVVNVVGEAGIGKTRLIAELKRHSVMKQVTLLEGRAISIGRNLSFHPIIDLLRQWTRIGEGDSEDDAFQKLEEAIQAIHPEETDEILPFVATLMGMRLVGKHADRIAGIQGEALEKLVLKNLRELAIKASLLRPLVIVVEDLHWADTSSIELLISLFHIAEKHAILFINVFRPGYWGLEMRGSDRIREGFNGKYAEISLLPLNEQSSRKLIDNMLNMRGLPHNLCTQINERAGGNPFFIEEVVQSLIDRGVLVITDHGFEVDDKFHPVVIPPTIQDVLMARIDSLDEQSRNLIKVASVIGRTFFYRILAAVLGCVDHLDNSLAYLEEIQMIMKRFRLEELEYLFRHALSQEAAYESTLLQQRKLLHLKVAQSIERIFRDKLREFYGILALHYSKADRPEMAEEYMVKAGDEALRSAASSEALNYFQQGLRLYIEKYGDKVDPHKLASFERKIALAYFYRVQYQEALPYFERVFRRWGKRSPANRVSTIIKVVLDLLVVMLKLKAPSFGRRTKPDQFTQEFFELALTKNIALGHTNPRKCFAQMIGELREILKHDLTKLDVAAVSLFSACILFSYTGLFRLSELLLAQGRQFVDTKRVRDTVVGKIAGNMLHFLSGKWAEMSEHDESLWHEGIRDGRVWSVAMYLYWPGAFNAYRGEFSRAEEAIERFDYLEDQYQFMTIGKHVLHTELLVVSRKSAQAETEADNALALSVARASETYELQSLGWRAVAQVLAGDIAQAEGSRNRLNEIMSKQEFWPAWYLGSSLLADFMLCLCRLEEAIGGDSRSAISQCRKACLRAGTRAVRNSAKFAAHRTWNYRLMGVFYWLIGKQADALKWWNKAIQEGERLGVRPDLARTYFEVGKRMVEPQSKYKQINGMNAKDYLEKAGLLFAEMRLENDLASLEKVRRP